MKEGYKHKTGTFGTDAENYVAQLMLLHKNPNGWRRPDLVSVNGTYNPKFSLEVKSGRKFKGVMVDYQLHYAITTKNDYLDLFDEEPPKREDLLPGLDKEPLPIDDVAYYYNVINRADSYTALDLKKPFSAIKLQWGSQFIVPHEFGFYSFALNRSRRSNESVEESIDYLRRLMQKDVLNGSSHYEDRKDDRNSWQDLHGRDIVSIFLDGRKSGRRDLGDDLLTDFPDKGKILTKEGAERVELLKKHYPEVEDLRKILIKGPNNTNIYVLAKPEDYTLMNTQLRNKISSRRPIIEELIRERKEAESLLDKIEISSYGLWENGDLSEKTKKKTRLKREDIIKLQRLCNWMTESETHNHLDIDVLPEKPKDDIPF